MKFNDFSILNNLICGVASDYIFKAKDQTKDIIKMTAFPQNKILFAKTQIPFKCMYVPAKISHELANLINVNTDRFNHKNMELSKEMMKQKVFFKGFSDNLEGCFRFCTLNFLTLLP